MSLRKILETFIRCFPSSFNRKYVHTVACTVVFVGPACFVCNAYPGRNATCPLSSCSNKNDGPRGRFNCISTVSCKRSVCVGVVTSFYGTFFVEEGQFINSKSLHIVPPLRRPSFHLLTPPRFGALSLPEVNQFTGNCFHMVRIVLKITFLKLRYPKGVTGRLPLCPIMALVIANTTAKSLNFWLIKLVKEQSLILCNTQFTACVIFKEC